MYSEEQIEKLSDAWAMLLISEAKNELETKKSEKNNPDLFFRRTCTGSNTGAFSTSDAKATHNNT